MLICLKFFWIKKMKLIEEVESRRDNKGRLRKRGKFFCAFCKLEVEKDLENGLRDKSCGCSKEKIQKNNQLNKNNSNYKHGESTIKLYRVWDGIKQRCSNPKTKSYKNYGGRGITICLEWTNDYTKFRDWALNNGYAEGLQINRINNNGNYCPENCEWITPKENCRNKRGVILTLEIANEIKKLYATGNYTQKELAEKFNVTQDHISRVINNKIWF